MEYHYTLGFDSIVPADSTYNNNIIIYLNDNYSSPPCPDFRMITRSFECTRLTEDLLCSDDNIIYYCIPI